MLTLRSMSAAREAAARRSIFSDAAYSTVLGMHSDNSTIGLPMQDHTPWGPTGDLYAPDVSTSKGCGDNTCLTREDREICFWDGVVFSSNNVTPRGSPIISAPLYHLYDFWYTYDEPVPFFFLPRFSGFLMVREKVSSTVRLVALRMRRFVMRKHDYAAALYRLHLHYRINSGLQPANAVLLFAEWFKLPVTVTRLYSLWTGYLLESTTTITRLTVASAIRSKTRPTIEHGPPPPMPLVGGGQTSFTLDAVRPYIVSSSTTKHLSSEVKLKFVGCKRDDITKMDPVLLYCKVPTTSQLLDKVPNKDLKMLAVLHGMPSTNHKHSKDYLLTRLRDHICQDLEQCANITSPI